MFCELECGYCYRLVTTQIMFNYIEDRFEPSYLCPNCNFHCRGLLTKWVPGFISKNKEFRLKNEKLIIDSRQNVNWCCRTGRVIPFYETNHTRPFQHFWDLWGIHDYIMVNIVKIFPDPIRGYQASLAKGCRERLLTRIWARKRDLVNRINEALARHTEWELNCGKVPPYGVYERDNVDIYVESRTDSDEFYVSEKAWRMLIESTSAFEKFDDIPLVSLKEVKEKIDQMTMAKLQIDMLELQHQIEDFCHDNFLQCSIETRKPCANKGYITHILVGHIGSLRCKNLQGYHESDRRESLRNALQKAETFLIENFGFKKTNEKRLFTSQLIDEIIRQNGNEETKQKPIKKTEVVQSAKNNRGSIEFQRYIISDDRWEKIEFDNNLTLGDFCRHMSQINGMSGFNIRLNIDNKFALSLYRSGGLDGDLGKYPLSTGEPEKEEEVKEEVKRKKEIVKKETTKYSDLREGYRLWLSHQTKAVQRGKVSLCEICKNSTGVLTDYSERGCGVRYCYDCRLEVVTKKGQLYNDEAENIDFAKRGWISVDLRTNKNTSNNSVVVLQSWRGGTNGRGAEWFVNIYSADKLLRTERWSKWVDYGLMEAIIIHHRITVKKADDYWSDNTVVGEFLAFRTDHPVLSCNDVNKFMYTLDKYYLSRFHGFSEKMSNMTNNDLEDLIYDKKYLLWLTGVIKEFPGQVSSFFRKLCIRELCSRLDPRFTLPILMNIVSGKTFSPRLKGGCNGKFDWVNANGVGEYANSFIKELKEAYDFSIDRINKIIEVYEGLKDVESRLDRRTAELSF